MHYFLYITGCDMNRSDAERIASVFNEHGFSITPNEKEADVVVAVACSVREKAVHKIYSKVHEWGKSRTGTMFGTFVTIEKGNSKNPKSPKNLKNLNSPIIVVTGCLLPEDKVKLAKKVDLVFAIDEIQKLQEWLNCQMAKLSKIQEEKEGKSNLAIYQFSNSDLEITSDYLSIKPIYQSNFSVNVPIMTGCDNFCTYCAVPYTRGREVSRSEDEILREVRDLVSRGFKEITLLGQNVNSYRVNDKFQITNHKQISNLKSQKSKKDLEINNNFVSLLKRIDQISGDYWVRFYSNHPKDMSDDLIDFLASAKHFCRYIHLPLQSGDNEIIKKMNRHYTAEQYLDLVRKIKTKIPDITLTTDVIVGFPGESEEAFRNTVKVMQESGFDMAFIAEYSPRGGTLAAKMEDDVPHEEKERRKKYLNDEVLAVSVLKNNKKMVGKIVRVLICEEGKNGIFKGKTAGLKDVQISFRKTKVEPSQMVGEFANVRIAKVASWGMEGEVA